MSNNFQGFVGAGEAVRYSLQIVADSFISKTNYVCEVAWGGKWSPVKEEMPQRISIKEIRE